MIQSFFLIYSELGTGPRLRFKGQANHLTISPSSKATSLGQLEAAQCCQRESWTALILASEISKEILPIPLVVDTDLSCTQMGQNRECPGKACRFFKQVKPVLFQSL